MRRWIGLFLFWVCIAGCSSWKTEQRLPPRLPQARLAHNSVGLEIATVSLPGHGEELFVEIERTLDELVMDPPTRRALHRNGLKCGLLGTQLPESIRQLLRAAEFDRAHPTAESVARGLELQRFTQCRAGREYDVSLPNPVVDIEMHYFDEETAFEKKYDAARCLFTLRCFSEEANGLSLEFTPEIEFGPPRQKWVSEGGTFHVESSQKREALDSLRMKLTLRPGETILITCIPRSEGVGKSFFIHPESNRQRLLLVRLAQAHVENLFHEEEVASLTTTIE